MMSHGQHASGFGFKYFIRTLLDGVAWYFGPKYGSLA